MGNSCSQLNDLPDEILLFIFKELNNIEVLYSLMDINKRLNKIVHDSTFTSHLSLLRHYPDHSIYPLTDSMLDRFCSKILPEIHHKIKWIKLESPSMKRILLATNYPNLYGLSLYNLDKEIAKSLVTDENLLNHTLKNQISSVIVNISKNVGRSSIDNVIKCAFTHILTVFTSIKYLNFGESLRSDQRLSFYLSPPSVISSTLLELHVSLEYFSDCLYLLDGRFNQLHTLYVYISKILSSHFSHSERIKIIKREKLPTLRCFSLNCDAYTNVYDELVLPFLHRMLNLEKL
ncbi:unnamed protein product, partial [Rotaria sordida]